MINKKGQLTFYLILGFIAFIVLAGSLVYFLDFLSDNFIYVIIVSVILLIWKIKPKWG